VSRRPRIIATASLATLIVAAAIAGTRTPAGDAHDAAPSAVTGAATAAMSDAEAEIRARRLVGGEVRARPTDQRPPRILACLPRSHGRRIFADRHDYSYRREPARIDVFEPRGIAAEHGHWRARWSAADGSIDVGGEYLMQWRRASSGWLVDAELFTPLHCLGGGYCQERP
jgi:hypothetical protein